MITASLTRLREACNTEGSYARAVLKEDILALESYVTHVEQAIDRAYQECAELRAKLEAVCRG